MSKKTAKNFKPLEWQVAPWRDQSLVMLLSGSAGGGKSHIALEKMNAYLLKYPGAFGIMIRKTRASMTNGSVLFFEDVVAVDQDADPHNGVRHIQGKNRFEYANGSVLVYTGMENAADREKLKSIGSKGGVDIAFMEEATEFELSDFNIVKSRMRGKAAPWRQLKELEIG